MHTYRVEIVGTHAEEVMSDPDKLGEYVDALLRATAQTAYEKIADKLAAVDFKNSQGYIHRALRWVSGERWAAVYFDDTIAPHALYQEVGVRPHTMRYLLKATAAIPIGVGNTTIYRWATERWMDRPHPMVDPVSGIQFMTKGWRHPGYEGHFFMRDGFKEAVQIMNERAPRFVFRLFQVGPDNAETTL